MQISSSLARFYLIRTFCLRSSIFIFFIFFMNVSLNSSLIRLSTGKKLPIPPVILEENGEMDNNGSIFSTSSVYLGRARDVNLIVQHFNFSPYAAANSTFASSGSLSLLQTQTGSNSDIVPELLSGPLNYPNPFNFDDGTSIGYRLSKDMDIQLTIYDQLGSAVFNDIFPAGSEGGRGGYNKLVLNNDTFNGEALSSGVYFYYLSFNESIIGKSKLAVVPKASM